MLERRRHPLVGTNAPVQAAAALLARALSGDAMRLTMLGSRKYSLLTEDLGELFESAARGVYDAFFVGGGQIDGQANVNLVGLGEYPNLTKRWPGSHGTPLLYMMIPNIVLSPRGPHDRRTLVSKVDFISAPGISPPEVFRPGGPVAMVTARCVFDFHKAPGGSRCARCIRAIAAKRSATTPGSTMTRDPTSARHRRRRPGCWPC